MTYPSQSTIRSYGGACPPSYLVGSLPASYSAGQAFTLHSAAGWYEVSATGQATSDPLGTSGPFVVVLDFSSATEEKVLCSAVNVTTGVVTVWTDGTNNGRGYDGTTISAHAPGNSGNPNVFPVATAVENRQLNSGVSQALADSSTALTTANNALSVANSKVSSVTAADGTITVAGTSTNPTVAVGTVPYSQISGTPSSLPPSGAAGGDLTGTYPNPNLIATGTAGTYGSATAVPVITTDTKGRVTSVTTQAPNDVTKLPLTGGTLTGALNGTTATFTGEVNASDFAPTGLTGATAATRYVGGTTSGAPTSGTFAVGDWVMDQQATLWVCIIAGTPGTWSPVPANSIYRTSVSHTASLGEITLVQGTGSGVTITLPANPVAGSTFGVINSANNPISIKGGSWPLFINGNNYGAGVSYTVAQNGVYSFVFSDNADNKWYAISTNDIGDMVNYGDVPVSKFGAATANVAMGGYKITGLANGTATTDAATYGQIPTSLPPSGSAGGDLTGTYPNPTLVAVGTASTYGSASQVPVLTTDTKGRVTGVVNTNIAIAESQVINLVTDLAGKASTSTTISAGTGLSGGGDLSANRTLSIATLSPSPAGTYGSASAVPAVTVNAQGQVTAVSTNTVNDTTKLPLAGGTMSGDIDLNSVARIKNAVLSQSSTDVIRANQVPAIPNISINSTTLFPLKAWNYDPATLVTFTSNTVTMTSGIMAFTAITLPYAATLTGVTVWHTTGGVPGTTGAVYQLGLYDTNGNLLASTPNNSGSASLNATGFFGWAFSSTYAASAGNYMIGMLWNSGTGGSPTTPIFGKCSNAGAAQTNVNCPTPSPGKLDQRACTAGSGRTTLYNPMNVTPTAAVSNFWTGLY